MKLPERRSGILKWSHSLDCKNIYIAKTYIWKAMVIDFIGNRVVKLWVWVLWESRSFISIRVPLEKIVDLLVNCQVIIHVTLIKGKVWSPISLWNYLLWNSNWLWQFSHNCLLTYLFELSNKSWILWASQFGQRP